MSKETMIQGMYAPLSGTGKIYDYRDQKRIIIKNAEGINVWSLTEPKVIWDKKCTYKQLCETTKALQDWLVG